MNLTRREKHVLIAAAIIIIIISITQPQLPVDAGLECLYNLFVIIPIGFYIATDPERRKAE